MEIIFVILEKFTISNAKKLLILKQPNLFVHESLESQMFSSSSLFFPLLFFKSMENKGHLRTASTQYLPKNKDH